jgi:broad specificity phosphatase PhoE
LDPAVGQAVLCSHGELIGAVLECLVGHDLDDAVELAWPKASTSVLDVDDGRLRQHHYLPPLRLHDTEAGYY